MTGRTRQRLWNRAWFRAAVALGALWVAAPGGCGGGGGGANITPLQTNPPPTNLSEADVNTIVLQAIHEATAEGKPATIAVVDRVGNVLTVAQMAGAPTTLTITDNDVDPGVPGSGPRGVTTGLLNQAVVPAATIPTTMGAITKALTGAYLSSNGNAFSTRTANQIIQEHFDPGVTDNPAGPLFGTQFSQLTCSDFNTLASATAGGTNAGPHRSPLGFSADSGGLPIYKNGILAGGIGVMTKDTYSLNPNTFAVPIDPDEVIALAGTTGYAAPPSITAPNIFVGGLTLQYTDASSANFAAPVEAIGSFTPVAVVPLLGGPPFFAGPAAGHTAIAGTSYGSTDGASGIAPDGALGPVLYPGTSFPAYVFTDGAGHVLYQPTAGLTPAVGAITAAEAQQLMVSALNVAFSARAAIRIPTNSFAQVTVTVVDLDGNVLAQARTPDAPVFGADVSRQKARSSVFFSRSDSANAQNRINGISAISPSTTTGTFADYITRSQALVGPSVFTDGIAWSLVGIGDISRPFYPDGIDGNPPGSLSLPFARWSVFSDGLQLDLAAADILNGIVTGAKPTQGCAYNGVTSTSPVTITPGTVLPTGSGGTTQLADGLQIFSGGYPIYRGSTLVGGIGVSGDGIQQDSMVSFLGIENGPGSLQNAPAGIRSNTLTVEGIALRYANCPADPFINQNVGNPCDF